MDKEKLKKFALPALVVTALLIGTAFFISPKFFNPLKVYLSRSKAAQTQPYGWDYNLTKRCVKSTNSSAANYFQDNSQCDSSGKNWTVAAQSEKTYETGSCPGPTNQSFPINAAGSPLLMDWLSHTDELGRSNWSVNLKTDLSATSHPCGAGYFTWYVLMDHLVHSGGPFPRPDQLSFSATVNFNDYTPNGATRAIAGWQGFWDGKARVIELTFQGTNWGDNYPNEPDIVDYLNTSSLQFVHMDGRALGILTPKEVDTKLNIDWTNIIKNLVSRGYLEAPSAGWENTVTTAVYVGHESHNWAASQSVISSLWVTNFRIESTVQATVTPTPTSTITPTPTATLTLTPTPTQSSTPTPSPTSSPTPRATPTPTPTATVTVTPTPSATTTPTPTKTASPTPTSTPSQTPRPGPTWTISPTITPTPSQISNFQDGDLVRESDSITVWIVKIIGNLWDAIIQRF